MSCRVESPIFYLLYALEYRFFYFSPFAGSALSIGVAL